MGREREKISADRLPQISSAEIGCWLGFDADDDLVVELVVSNFTETSSFCFELGFDEEKQMDRYLILARCKGDDGQDLMKVSLPVNNGQRRETVVLVAWLPAGVSVPELIMNTHKLLTVGFNGDRVGDSRGEVAVWQPGLV